MDDDHVVLLEQTDRMLLQSCTSDIGLIREDLSRTSDALNLLGGAYAYRLAHIERHLLFVSWLIGLNTILAITSVVMLLRYLGHGLSAP
jgi:hypothetical protein